MSYTNQEKAQFYKWWIESGRDYVTSKRRVRKGTGRHAKVPSNAAMKDWQAKFVKMRACVNCYYFCCWWINLLSENKLVINTKILMTIPLTKNFSLRIR